YYRMFFDGNNKLDQTIRRLHPDMVVLSSLMVVEAPLLATIYKIPVAFFRSSFCGDSRQRRIAVDCFSSLAAGYHIDEIIHTLTGAGAAIRTLQDIVPIVARIPEVIALPEGFERSREDCQENEIYIGPALDLERAE